MKFVLAKENTLRRHVFCKHDFRFKWRKKQWSEKWQVLQAHPIVTKLLNSKSLIFKSMSGRDEGWRHYPPFHLEAKFRSSRHLPFLCQHVTVEGCLSFVFLSAPFVNSLCFCIGFILVFAPFLWLPITIKCKTDSLDSLLSFLKLSCERQQKTPQSYS